MPSDLMLKSMNTVHRALLTLSGGRLGWTMGELPVLELTTIGRKSGQARTVMLTSPLQVGETVIVVASRGGDDINPAWYLNLVANPNVEVSLQGKPKDPWLARVATPEERAVWWAEISGKFKNYADYQTKTEREIPLVALTKV